MIESKTRAFTCVGIGASAGGLAAIEEFFKNMQPDNGMSFVIIQHLSPDFKSMMNELLTKHTQMPVFTAQDGIKIQKNCIFLLPPKFNMTIFNEHLYLQPYDHSMGLNLPIDSFFCSLADDFGNKAVAIILSGTGSDGTSGIRAIKNAGGLVLTQDEQSAKFFGMPKSSISTGLVDYILAPSKMPEILLNYTRHHQKTDSSDTLIPKEEHLHKILKIIKESIEVDFTHYKTNTIYRRLEKRMGMTQKENIEDYIDFLNKNTNEVYLLYKDLLIGVTRFFRDTEAFEIIRKKVLPKIFHNYPANKNIRFWCTGCSTGEEAYSLAILVAEYLEENKLETDIKIFATDIDQKHIEIAAAGIFPKNIAGDVSPERLDKYFIKTDENYHIKEKIRKMIIFACQNLIKDPPFSKIDLISCRNILIYLNQNIQNKILSMFYHSLNPGAFLFLGSSETLGNMSEGFKTIHNKWKIYKHKEGFLPLETHNFLIPHIQHQIEFQNNDILKKTYKSKELYLSESVWKHLLNQYLPPSVIVDKEFQILHIFNNITEYMSFSPGKADMNVLNCVKREIRIILSSMLYRILKDKKPITFKEIKLQNNIKEEYISISTQMINCKPPVKPLILITFEETKKENQTVLPSSESLNYQEHINEHSIQLKKELQYSKENLQASIEELETSNEELQSTNEELIASNEELQSTNEELQSVNEKLYTVNAEHQKKIEELSQLNNDMNNLLLNTNIGILYLDSDLKIRKYTSMITRIINIMELDIGRSIKPISLNVTYPGFYDDLEEVKETLKSKEIEVQDKEGNWSLIKIKPYRTAENAIEGLSVTMADINNLKKSEEKSKTLGEKLESTLNIGKLSWWELDYKNNILRYSSRINKLLGYRENETDNDPETWASLIHPDDREKVKNAMQAHVNNEKESYQAAYRIQCKSGDWKFFLDTGRIIERDTKNKAVRIAGILMDITENKKYEKELKRQHEFLFRILENSPTGKTFVDKSGTITYANVRACEILDLDEKSLGKYNYNASKWKILDLTGKIIPDEKLPFPMILSTKKSVKNYVHSIENDKGIKKYLNINGAPLFDENNMVSGAVFCIDEIEKP